MLEGRGVCVCRAEMVVVGVVLAFLRGVGRGGLVWCDVMGGSRRGEKRKDGC